MKQHFIIFVFLLTCITCMHAQSNLRERVYLHTDKTCYLAGENIWVKFFTTDTGFQPSSLSKVGYIELVDTVRPQAQLKLALQQGSGWGFFKIPVDVPSGIYQLRGYTRYMRNENENIYFKKEIAIINTFSRTEPEQTVLAKPGTEYHDTGKIPSLIQPSLSTDKPVYPHRTLVELTIGQSPTENVTDLTLSVVRDDSLVSVTPVDIKEWKKQSGTTSSNFTGHWIAEYEGHIICGRITTPDENIPNTPLTAELAVVGKDLRYMQGQLGPKGDVTFYTGDIYGTNELIIASSSATGTPYRIDLISPFDEKRPDALPLLKLYPNQKDKLLERSIGVQLQQIMAIDSLEQATPIKSSYYHLQPSLSYDLDNYTRFNTMEETFTEFIRNVSIRRVGNKRRLSVLKEGKNIYNTGNTLVTLDGVPIHNHEDILKYNPRLVKKIEIFNGRYGFGGKTFECMVTFTTKRGNLPDLQLDNQSQLIVYECPQLPVEFNAPDYGDTAVKDSRVPDFRHTLYWNPSVPVSSGKTITLQFYTSDLSGNFKVVLEGFTQSGENIYNETTFEVK